ncbi:MAG: folylpolyglutamate synthase/dihydrofolate synthase family protein [Pontixanthobacter sp.]
MKDFGRSDHPAVQTQLDRLAQLSLPDGRFGLDAIRALLARLGNPHRHLPPVFHVAGTNGKGSTCAFLRAMLEADGKTVHVTTSPHLVRYNERIRIAGKLIEDEALAPLLEEVLDAGEDLAPSFFEVTIAAAFLAFSRTPADACVVEVGLGGRFDATNALEPEAVAVCGIAALGIDHERFLLAPEEGVPTDPMARIAFEKAGIAKSGVPLVTLGETYPPQARAAIAEVALNAGAPLVEYPTAWAAKMVGEDNHLAYGEGSDCYFHTLPPSLPGRYQALNAGLAIAMLRRQTALPVGEEALKTGVTDAKWPARLQHLSAGPLIGSREVWLDGGHNRSAGEAIARHFAGQRLHLIIGMIEGKDPASLTQPLADSLSSITAVPISTHVSQAASAYSPDAAQASSVQDALAALPDDGLPILIAGSLYLAGDVLRLNGEMPD